MGRDVDSIAARFPDPWGSDETLEGDEFGSGFPMGLAADSNLYKLCRVFAQHYWDEIEEGFGDLRTQMIHDNKTGGTLDNFAEFWGLGRKVDESDTALRLRVQSEMQKRIGGTTPNDILRFLEKQLGVASEDLAITENEDPTSGNYKKAQFYVTVLNDDIPDDITQADMGRLMDRLAAAGVKAEIKITTEAEWDTATWDEDDYGS